MKTRLLILVLALGAALIACQPTTMGVVTLPAPTAPSQPTLVPTTAASPTLPVPTATATASASESPLYIDASQPIEKRVDDLMARMTLAEKIGQMTQAENYSVTPDAVTKFGLGSVLSGGGSYRSNSPQDWRDMVTGYEQAALASRLGIPLLFGVDAVHGHGHIAGATYFPQNIALGATRDADLVERIGRATANQLTPTGIRWDFAPVVAVPQDVRWGRTYEGYSENTDLVTELGTAFVKGLQDVDGKPALDDPTTVLATPKHFIGDGGTAYGTSKTVGERPYLIDQGDMQVDEATLRELFLPPYKSAIDAGAQAIMASYSSWNGVKVHASKALLTDLLKDELGFEGFVVSDWGGIDQISPDYDAAVATAINAGIDMAMVPYDYERFINAVTKGVESGAIPQERIDDAVRRILTVKFKLGLFEHAIPETDGFGAMNSPEVRALAREAVQKSLVLLRNENQTLPLKKDTPLIFVTGQGANNTGIQSGGWTIEWQGVNRDVGGTTILQGIKDTVSPNTRVVYDTTAKFADQVDVQGKPVQADVGIMVIAEQPYAEGLGDRPNLSLSPNDLQRLAVMRERSKQLVVLLVSGRPLVVTEALPQTDAFVAAWLPGTEGGGIADVLFGDVPFTGKLPYTFPRSNAQLPFDFKDLPTSGCDAPLFPYGFGLSTSDASPPLLDCK